MLNAIIKTLLLHHRKLTFTSSELTRTVPIFLSIWQMLCVKYPVCWSIFFTLHIIHCQPGLCSWVQEVNNDVNWTRSTGLQVQDKPWDGPQYDHTDGNNEGINQSAFLKTLNELRVKSWPRVKKHHVKQPLSKLAKAWHQTHALITNQPVCFLDEGFFLLLYGSGSKDRERAVVSLTLPAITSAQICVGFWYHMLGPSVSTLDLLLKTVRRAYSYAFIVHFSALLSEL